MTHVMNFDPLTLQAQIDNVKLHPCYEFRAESSANTLRWGIWRNVRLCSNHVKITLIMLLVYFITHPYSLHSFCFLLHVWLETYVSVHYYRIPLQKCHLKWKMELYTKDSFVTWIFKSNQGIEKWMGLIHKEWRGFVLGFYRTILTR